MHKLWCCGVILFCIGCQPSPVPHRDPAQSDPANAFRALEDRLLQAETIQMDFHVTAEGAVEADLRGELKISSTNGVRLTGAGQFAGQMVDLVLQTEGEEYMFGNRADGTVAPVPDHLTEALVIGLTRMGILHNLARLTGAAPPDHADGGVRECVEVNSVTVVPDRSGSTSFDLTVSGEPSGSALLEIDSSGRPVVRRQTVRFAAGEMRVVERYSSVTINP